MADGRASLPVRLITRVILNIALVWVMATYLSDYFVLTGGFIGMGIVGSLITLLNIIVRPILSILTFPLKLIATMVAVIIVNGVFIEITNRIVQEMNPDLVTMEITGGLTGWVVVAVVLGFGNWLMKEAVK